MLRSSLVSLLSTNGQRSAHSSLALATRRAVRVYWDLDNVHPIQSSTEHVEAYTTPLLSLTNSIGELVSMQAWANTHAFKWMIKEERTEKKQAIYKTSYAVQDARSGLDEDGEGFRCGVCGSRQKTFEKLKRHMKSLHERERQKILNRFKQTKKRPAAKLAKLAKYNRGRQNVFAFQTRNDLQPNLIEHGVEVIKVSNEEEAADKALVHRAMSDINSNALQSLVLVSSDTDFVPLVMHCKKKDIDCIVASFSTKSETGRLAQHCDAFFNMETCDLQGITERGHHLADMFTSMKVS